MGNISVELQRSFSRKGNQRYESFSYCCLVYIDLCQLSLTAWTAHSYMLHVLECNRSQPTETRGNRQTSQNMIIFIPSVKSLCKIIILLGCFL